MLNDFRTSSVAIFNAESEKKKKHHNEHGFATQSCIIIIIISFIELLKKIKKSTELCHFHSCKKRCILHRHVNVIKRTYLSFYDK